MFESDLDVDSSEDFILDEDEHNEESDKLLSYWGLSNYIDAFKRNKITVDLIPKISDDELKELIPTIGDRIIFKAKYKNNFERKRTLNNSENNNSDLKIAKVIKTGSDSFDPTLILNTLPPIDKLLEGDQLGKSILRNYSITAFLDENTMNRLVDILIKELSSITDRANDTIFRGIGQKICQTFPSETLKTYFISPIKKRNSIDNASHKSKGKIVVKWRNFLQLCKSSKDIDKNILSIQTEPSNGIQEDDDINWLQENEFANIDITIPYWERTANKRLSRSSLQLHEIFNKWKILKHPEAYKLIKIDFSYLALTSKQFNEASWTKFLDCIMKVCKISEKDETAKELQFFIKEENKTFDQRFKAGLQLLCHFIPPKAIAKKRKQECGSSKTWKVSIAEAFSSIVQYTRLPTDMEELRQERINLMYDYKKTVQPYIIVTGPSRENLDGFYVSIDISLYKLSTFEEAFNICFQCFHVFGTMYPFESEHIWLLIQKSIFGFSTKYDKTFANIETVLNAIERCMSLEA